MDLSSVVRYYVDRMLKEVPGMKVLLLDADTTRIVSTVYSQSEILEHEVYLVERLDADRRDQLFHLKVLLHLALSCCCSVSFVPQPIGRSSKRILHMHGAAVSMHATMTTLCRQCAFCAQHAKTLQGYEES